MEQYEILSTGITLLSLSGETYISGNTLYLSTDGSVKVYNVNGQFVLSASGTTIDVSSLIKGIYIINTGSQVFKVVKK